MTRLTLAKHAVSINLTAKQLTGNRTVFTQRTIPTAIAITVAPVVRVIVVITTG
jgi:hypothetical protein